MKKKLLFLLAAVFLTGFGAIYGQDRTVSGTVLDDASKETLIGVSVTVKGTTVGTITDVDGKFEITLPEGSSVLVFEFTGYTKKEMPAKNGMSVLLEDSSEQLETVEVFAGVTKGKGYSGSAQTLSADAIEKKNPSDITKALAGEFAGVQVVTSSGQPGTTANIRMRGINSVNAGTSPLYVVDGIPYYGDISSIDPSDIASTTILKDATATALYGSRGANGVILITTKKGTAGTEGKIDVDVKFGLNMRLIPLYETINDPKQYTELGWQGFYTNSFKGNNHSAATTFANNALFRNVDYDAKYGVSVNYNPFDTEGKFLINPETGRFYNDVDYLYRPENWAKHIFHTGKKYEATVKFSGGSEKVTYYTSFGFLNDEGYYIQSDWKRFTARSNVDFEPKKWLKGNLNLAYAYNIINSPGQGDNMNSGFQYINGMPPIYPVYQHARFVGYDAKGKSIYERTKDPIYDPIIKGPAYDYGLYDDWGRPFGTGINPAGALQLDKELTNAHNLDGSSVWEVQFYKDLKFMAYVGFQYYGGLTSELTNMFYGDAEGLGRIDKSTVSYMNLVGLQMLQYQKTILDDHNIDAFIAHNASMDNYSWSQGYKSQLFNPYDLEFSNAAVLDGLYSGKHKEMRESYLGQIRYNYKETYFINFNGNLDASSNFAKGYRWGKFGSVGASWTVTKEKFMKDTKSWLTNLRLRASYGVAGNDGIGDFRYTDLYGLSVIDKQPAIYWAYKGVDSITWERSNILDIGLEITIKKDRLKLEVDYYNRVTNKLLFPRPVAPSLGYTSILSNDGSIKNAGIDWMITSKVVKTRNVELSLRLNGNFNRSKVLALPYEMRFGDRRQQIMSGSLAVGHALDEWYFRSYAGVDPETGESQWIQYYDENVDPDGVKDTYIIDVYTYTHQDTEDGSLLYPDADIRTKITKNMSKAGYNFIGKRRGPYVYGGFGIDFTAYGFELSAMFNYQLGGYGYDNIYAQMMGDEAYGQTSWHKDMLGAWKHENYPGGGNTGTNVPRLTGGLGQYAPYANYLSDRFLTSNNAFQISNVKLAYYFPKRWIKKALLNSLSVWVSGDNLYVASARKGYFPFASFSGTNHRSQYVPLSTFLGGIKLQF